jgi:hypothetical protein
MNLNLLQNRLLRAARQDPPSEAAPYAFEKRIMSRLGARQPESAWAWWGASLWRGAAACMAITLLCGVWSYTSQRRPAEAASDFSQDLEATVFASMNQPGEGDW